MGIKQIEGNYRAHEGDITRLNRSLNLGAKPHPVLSDKLTERKPSSEATNLGHHELILKLQDRFTDQRFTNSFSEIDIINEPTDGLKTFPD